MRETVKNEDTQDFTRMRTEKNMFDGKVGIIDTTRHKDIMDLRFSLVCLVAVPHFDSPFNETDHVFILSQEKKQ